VFLGGRLGPLVALWTIVAQQNGLERLIGDLRRHRTEWQLRAELDPTSVVGLASEAALLLGMPRELALRVIEDELGCSPLLDRREFRNRPTDHELPIVDG
jgi:hypothetical protein